MRVWLSILIVAIAILVLDIIAIQLFFRRPYQEAVERLQGHPMQIKWVPAVMVYVFMITGCVLFVLLPIRNHRRNLREGVMRHGILLGACYGAVLYAVYALTIYSIIDPWPLQLVIVDIAWGGVLYGCIGCLSVYLMNGSSSSLSGVIL